MNPILRASLDRIESNYLVNVASFQASRKSSRERLRGINLVTRRLREGRTPDGFYLR